MRIRDLSPADFLARLGGDGVRLAAGPFNCRLQSGIPEIAEELARPSPDQSMVQALKRRKLRIKEELSLH